MPVTIHIAPNPSPAGMAGARVSRAKHLHVTQPRLDFDIRMGSGGGWQCAGDYSIWTTTVTDGEPPIRLLERRENGVIEHPDNAFYLYHLPAGVPHRLNPVFGFWRVSEADVDVMRARSPQGAYYTLLVNTASSAYARDRILWFCRECGTTLSDISFETRRYGVAAYFAAATEHVRTFNSGTRACPHCGAVHLPAYGFDPGQDDDHERAARALW